MFTLNPVLDPASRHAGALSNLFVVTLIVCAAIFGIVAGFVVWSVVRFRRSAITSEPPQVTGNTKLEIGWTLGSVLVLCFLLVMMVRAMGVVDPPADGPAAITVIGHQWWWEVRYANGPVTANEIHIETGTDVLVRIEAADVIHSFWVPQLGRKMDAIPGHPNQLWIRADQAGEYRGTCSEFCGAQHAGMRILVVAQSPEAFHGWSSRQSVLASVPTNPAALHGDQLFHQKACASCHAIREVGVASAATSVAPDLTHFASRETIAAGVLQNTPANVRLWLRDPQQIKPGSHMPDFHLATTDVDDLTAFLETLN